MKIYLVSACLVGLKTRYDGKVIPGSCFTNDRNDIIYLPVCPEQLGGLPTPRTAADLAGGDGTDVLEGRAQVMTRDGEEVTENFIRGARQVLTIARLYGISGAMLKAGSPSCGLTSKVGVTAALLQTEGYVVQECP